MKCFKAEEVGGVVVVGLSDREQRRKAAKARLEATRGSEGASIDERLQRVEDWITSRDPDWGISKTDAKRIKWVKLGSRGQSGE